MSNLLFFQFELTNFQSQVRGMFLVGLSEEMIPGSDVGCVQDMTNTVVFVRFHFSTYLVNWMISD